MPVPLPVSGVCPLGTVPVYNRDGSISCWDPTEPGYPGSPAQGQKPEPNPGSPAGGAQPPARPNPPLGSSGSPPPAASPIRRQPGAPAAPYNPPGRIGLWPGPLFNPPASTATTFSTSTSGGVTGDVGAEGPIFVDVSNAVNLADNSASNAVQSVADAVRGAIGAAVQDANGVALTTQENIGNALLQNVGAIDQGVGTVFTTLLQGLQALNLSVGGALGDIGTTIGSDLVNSLNPVTNALEALVLVITRQIGGLGGEIAGAVAQIIPLIVAAIENPIGALKGVLNQIEIDIGANLASLTQIPGAIAQSSTSLDATLQRTLSGYESFTESQTGWGKGDTAHSDLEEIIKALSGLVTSIQSSPQVKASDHIPSVCGQAELTKLLNTSWTELATQGGFWEGVINFLIKGGISALFYIASILPAIRKSQEEVSQRFDQSCPIAPLPVNAVVEANLRGFLSGEEAVIEAAKNDISAGRLKILHDLATHQMSPAELVEALYRGIISQPDFNSALTAQGWQSGQQAILQALGVALLTVSESLELYRRGAIDKPTLQSILQAHAYDKAQQDALSGLAFRPPNVSEAIDGGAANDALNGLNLLLDPGLLNPPEFVERAGAAEGLDHDATTDRWQSHWNLGGLPLWIDLYFRGQATLESVKAIAKRQMVPDPVLMAFIEVQRPLVQFRTISTMLRLNLISEASARALLAQHGYSQGSIDTLIAYAQRPAPTKAAKNAAALHSTSLGIAKEEYIDGSITGDQYLAILTQHGYTTDGANTELQVVNAHQALLRRKEQAQLVIDEYGAGLIDEQAALAQLAVLGLTVDELARAAHKIRAFKGKNAKHPSEADLHNFLKNGIISNDEYVAELVAQGYSKKWAGDFLAWRTSAAATTQASATPPPPTP